MKYSFCNKRYRGFTLIELLVVIAIIGLLSTLSVVAVSRLRENAKVVKAGFTQSELRKAIELYYNDIGFYPPDVNRGWDPGFTQSLPSNPDTDAGETPPNGYDVPNSNCNHCPVNWQNIVAARWNGPYMTNWPRHTPWNGKFDYNYWGNGATRGGCPVLAGIYTGVQGDYEGNNEITSHGEQKMIEKGYDSENCTNGESQLLLWLL